MVTTLDGTPFLLKNSNSIFESFRVHPTRVVGVVVGNDSKLTLSSHPRVVGIVEPIHKQDGNERTLT